MSLVQAVISEKFILIGADSRGIQPDGTIVENCNKLIKLNKAVIFGCTGGVLDNYELFDGYCIYSEKLGLLKMLDDIEISYVDFVHKISQNFNSLYYKHKNGIRKYGICSLIGGYNGKEFEVTTFSLGAEYDFPDGILKVTKSPTFPYKGISAGKPFHKDVLHELVEKTYFTYGDLTMRQYKNIMLDVFTKGSKTDLSINNTIHFESMRKKDVI